MSVITPQAFVLNVPVGSLTLGANVLQIAVPEFASGTLQGAVNRYFDAVQWRIDGAAGITAGAISFYEVCLDGVLRLLTNPPPQTIPAASHTSGFFQGNFHSVVMQVSTAFATAGLTYAEMRASWRTLSRF